MSQPLYQAAEVLDMAVQIEKNGLAFYTGCAAAQASEQLGELFGYLAEQEKLHIKVFSDMKQGLEERTLPESYPGETQAYLASLVSDRVFPADQEGACRPEEITDPMDAIAIALSMEKQSILFYSGLRALVRASEQQVMDRVIEEEHEHVRRLLSLRRSLGGA